MVIRSRSEPGVRRYAPSRRVRLVADLGLALLPVLAVETLTGLVLFLFAHGLTPKGSAWAGHVFDLLAAAHLLVIQEISFQTDVHVWVGYLTTWTLALKAWASWPTLIGWCPRRFSAERLRAEKVAASALLALAPASYLSGITLALRLFPLHVPIVRDVHLWVSVLLIPPLAWHMIRFFPEGLKVFSVQVDRTFCSVRQMDIAGRGRSSELRRALPNQKNVLH